MKSLKQKLKRGEELLIYLIDKMLEGKSSYQEVKKFPQIDGVLWCSYYTWTKKEEEEFKVFFIDTLVNKASPKYSRRYAESEWPMFNLMYGLRTIKD